MKVYMTDDEDSLAAFLMRSEIEMMGVLVGFSVVVVLMSWLDEAIELRLYSDAAEAEQCKCMLFIIQCSGNGFVTDLQISLFIRSNATIWILGMFEA